MWNVLQLRYAFGFEAFIAYVHSKYEGCRYCMHGAYMKPTYALDIPTLYMHSMCTCDKCIQHTRSTYAQSVQYQCVRAAYALSVCIARASIMGGAQHLRYRGIAALPDEHCGITAGCSQGTSAILWQLRTTCITFKCDLSNEGDRCVFPII